jgi:hypothetical protein
LVGFWVNSYNFRVGSGYVLSSSENFGPRPTRRTVGSGRGFFGWVGSGLSGRAAHDQVYACEAESPLEIAIGPERLLSSRGRTLGSEPGLREALSPVFAGDDGLVSLEMMLGRRGRGLF